jgi:hypothetical protein
LLVSDLANGTVGFEESPRIFDGKTACPPRRPEWRPETGHLQWHGRAEFKERASHQP